MSAHNKPIRPSNQLNIQSWQLPDWDGPTVNEVDALGNRDQRKARMDQARHPERVDETPATTDPAEPEYEPPTAAELQALREEARAEGFAEGKKEGYDAGYANGKTEGEQAGRQTGEEQGYADGQKKSEAAAVTALAAEKQAVAKQLGAAIAQMNQREQALEDELAPIARDLILRLTQGLVVQSLQQSPEQIEEIVHQAIQLMPAAHERMDVFMHPDDISLLRGLDLHWLANVSLRVDESLSPGGCTVKTRHSLLDYSLSQRYQAQIQALLDNDLPPPDDTLRALSLERFQTLVERLPGAPSTVPEHDDETDATVSSDDVEDDAAGADAETTEEDDVSGASAVPPKEDDVAGADPAPPEEDDHAQTE